MFGRRNKQDDTAAAEPAAAPREAVREDSSDEVDAEEVDAGGGPYDSSEVTLPEGESDGRLDLGSVRLPLIEGAQIQVEMEESGELRSVHLLTEVGRITVAAFAAPRTEGMWREVLGELAQSLKDDGAAVRFEDGPWGREVVGVGAGATLRFVGVDGPRWMVRGVAAGPEETQEPLSELVRDVLRQTVVVRGVEAMPVRSPLPIALPAVLVQQLEEARQQGLAGQEQQEGQAAPD